MNNILKIASQASKALAKLENGQTYRISDVLNRFEKTSNENSSDLLVCNARDVIRKMSSRQEFITQKEITSIYNSLYGFSGNRSIFKQALGDLLVDGTGEAKVATASYEKNRDRYEVALEPIYDKMDLADSFSSIFSLDSTPSYGTYNKATAGKAERFVKAQLNSIDHFPYSIKALDGNEHFILCTASFDTPSFTKVDVKIPVQVTGGTPRLPDSFISGSDVEELNKKNLMVYIKSSENQKARNATHKFAADRNLEFLRTEPAILPASLNRLADLDTHIVTAISKFDKREVDMARSVVSAELKAMGAFNPQVKVSHSTDTDIVFSTYVKTASGDRQILVPVEIQNGSAILPSTFECDSKLYKFNSKNILDIIKGVDGKITPSPSRDAGALSNMSYHELMDRVIDGVSSNDYKMSEESLTIISNRFGTEMYKASLGKFSDLLKAASQSKKRNDFIKAAFKRGDLINVPSSVEPYSPKFGVVLSKLAFDDEGNLALRRRAGKSENLKNSGTGISSYNIVLT
jgi:hypothetical protein